ncbi:MAG: AAA family ATPase [Acidimicrobiia bacterium]
MLRTITISANYGSGGALIAPALAELLGLPFHDRLLRGTGPSDDQTAPSENLTEAERSELPLRRLLAGFAFLPEAIGSPGAMLDLPDDRRIRQNVEQSVLSIADSTGGVILGRGGACVLADKPGVFHARIDGPVDRRLAVGMRLEEIDEATARRHLTDTDKARTQYLKRLYGRDPRDPTLYHLVIDGTAFDFDTSAQLIAHVATTYWERGLA